MPKDEENFVVGDIIERSIDDLNFIAIIETINYRSKTVSITYLDDLNTEDNVPFDEINLIPNFNKKESKLYQNYLEEKELSNNDTTLNSPRPKTRGADTLPRPLAGLVEDDYETRNNFIPTVSFHNKENKIKNISYDSEDSKDNHEKRIVKDADDLELIVMNGAENKLAAGGGLRALRYLKN